MSILIFFLLFSFAFCTGWLELKSKDERLQDALSSQNAMYRPPQQIMSTSLSAVPETNAESLLSYINQHTNNPGYTTLFSTPEITIPHGGSALVPFNYGINNLVMISWGAGSKIRIRSRAYFFDRNITENTGIIGSGLCNNEKTWETNYICNVKFQGNSSFTKGLFIDNLDSKKIKITVKAATRKSKVNETEKFLALNNKDFDFLATERLNNTVLEVSSAHSTTHATNFLILIMLLSFLFFE